MPLLGLPEELLTIILELTVPPLQPRLSLPDSRSLLTCHTLYRIGLPILYRALLLKSSSDADLIRRTLLERPALVRHVHHLYSTVTALSLQLVLRAIGHANGSLHTLDFSINPPWVSGRLAGSDEEEPLAAVPVRHLSVRLGHVIFLHSADVSSTLADAIRRWPNLETVEIEPRFLFSPTPWGRPSAVALALSRSPLLRVLRTPLPPAWESSLLLASENPSLERIVLTKSRLSSGPEGISSGYEDMTAATLVAEKDRQPWLVEAQMHSRLMQLIVSA